MLYFLVGLLALALLAFLLPLVISFLPSKTLENLEDTLLKSDADSKKEQQP